MTAYDSIVLDAISHHHNDPKWQNAKYGGIKVLANPYIGAVGQEIVEGMCSDAGLAFTQAMSASGLGTTRGDWDIKIEGMTIEIKTATEDTLGKFQFNHIRPTRDYQALLCLGVSPDNVHFGIWSKNDAMNGLAGNLTDMEKRERSDGSTYKLIKLPHDLLPLDKFGEKMKAFIEEQAEKLF